MGRNLKEHAILYDFYNHNILKGQNDDIDYFIKLLDNINPKKILMVGAGTGRVAIPLSKIYKIDALDMDEKRLELLSEKCSDIKTIKADFIDFYTEEKYDVIIFPYSTLQYGNDMKKINDLIKKSGEIIDNNGYIIFDVSSSFENKSNENNKLLFTEHCDKLHDDVKVVYTAKKNKSHINFIVEYSLLSKKSKFYEVESYLYFDKEEYEKMVKHSGFDIINVDDGYDGKSFKHKHIYLCRKNEL